ncbi:MAG: galactosyldiacylglycerol synthase [Meiothermus sp.]
MIQLFNADTGDHLGEISEAQLQFLEDQMEEESADDQDYYINADLVQTWKEAGADPALIDLLNKALAGREDVSIRWER